MTVSEKTFRRVALEHPSGHWELHCGKLRQKPGMTAAHNNAATNLVLQLGGQLNPSRYRFQLNAGHVRRSADRYYIPNVFVIPTGLLLPLLSSRELEVYEIPLPLVVEV
jgi:hypothetical protein